MSRLLEVAIATVLISVFINQDSRTQHKFTVQVDVRDVDGDMTLPVKSYLSRELRELRDVRVSDITPAFTLLVEIINVNAGGVSGYILYAISLYNDSKTKDKVFINSAYFKSRPENIERYCKELVAGFDQSVLEPLRK